MSLKKVATSTTKATVTTGLSGKTVDKPYKSYKKSYTSSTGPSNTDINIAVNGTFAVLMSGRTLKELTESKQEIYDLALEFVKLKFDAVKEVKKGL